MNKPVVVFYLSLLFAANAQALTFTESEITDFDFPGVSGFSNGFTVGTLDIGANTISGSLSSECVGSTTFDCNIVLGTDSQDSLLVQVDSATVIDSILVTTSIDSMPAGFNSSFNIRDDSTDYVFEPRLANDATSDNLLDTVLGAGIYSISMFGQHANVPGLYDMNWSIELNVSPVPLPAALWLFASGLLGLIGFSRYKRI
ncbi:MAG: VPLPA-CTERM sorting domain-containing protein [Candidatus Thiodiazotropha sp.]